MRKLLLCSVILALLSSCNLPRQAANNSKRLSKNQSEATIDTILQASDIIENSILNQPSFRTMNIPKFDLRVQFGQAEYTLRGSLRIITDSIISLSIQPMLGIEVARIDFTPEYFTVYDKMNHRFSETPYDAMYIGTGIPFDFHAIQSMLSGQFYSIPHRDKHSFQLDSKTDSTYVFIGQDNLNNMFQYFEISFGSYFVAVSGLQRSKSQSLPYSITYSDWRMVNRKYKYPFSLSVELDHNKFFFLANASIEEIEFDKEVKITKINLERYTRVSFNTYFTEQKI